MTASHRDIPSDADASGKMEHYATNTRAATTYNTSIPYILLHIVLHLFGFARNMQLTALSVSHISHKIANNQLNLWTKLN